MFHCISDLDGVREQSHFQAQKNTSTLLMANKWKKVHFGVREVDTTLVPRLCRRKQVQINNPYITTFQTW